MNPKELMTELKLEYFMAYIIKSLDIEISDFIVKIIKEDHKSTYKEKLIYNWTITLFNKGKSTDEALVIIHRALAILVSSPYKKTIPSMPIRKRAKNKVELV